MRFLSAGFMYCRLDSYNVIMPSCGNIRSISDSKKLVSCLRYVTVDVKGIEVVCTLAPSMKY